MAHKMQILNKPNDWEDVEMGGEGVLWLGDHVGAEGVRVVDGDSIKKCILFKTTCQVTQDEWDVTDHVLILSSGDTICDAIAALPKGSFCLRIVDSFEIERI